MKLNRWFIVGILIFLVLMFLVELRLPKNFSWTPTFQHADKEPFGACLFDSLMERTMPMGYSITDSSLYQLAKDSLTRRAILVVADAAIESEQDAKSVLTLADNGSHVILAAHMLGSWIEDTLGIRHQGYSQAINLQRFVKYNRQRDTLVWVDRSMGYQPRTFAVFGPLLSVDYTFPEEKKSKRDSLHACVLAESSYYDEAAVAITFQWGKGYITCCSVPLLLTNYGIVDQDNAGFSLRLMSLVKDLPVVRTQCFCPSVDATEQSPLRYLISQPPLRWALYVAMLGALSFIFLGGRRRQRVIPIVKRPENNSLEFIHLVGTLYYHSKERRSLVVRKWTYFAEELRRTVHIDVTDVSEDDVSLPALARLTGVDETEVRKQILSIRQLVADEDAEITKKQMKQYIDQMNWIIKNI